MQALKLHSIDLPQVNGANSFIQTYSRKKKNQYYGQDSGFRLQFDKGETNTDDHLVLKSDCFYFSH